jgi:transcriptional regulator with PAS, ATPase and Fis domain
MYEEGWIDAKNRLTGFPLPTFTSPFEQQWESDGKNGRWRFILRPCIYEGRPIGAIIEAFPPYRNNSKTVSTTKYSFSSLIGNSSNFLAVVSEAYAAAGNDLPVLIEGESGTGKELLAQSIHAASRRAHEPFVAVNCASIPKDLAASEFFGFDGGSFTGAAREGRMGKFQQANGGTIFLDEIGEMSSELQTLLLRVLEEGEVVRLGGRKPVQLNVRVIAATNTDLMSAVENGAFRRDLYYRLNILSLRLPPLRERQGDVALLLQHLLRKACPDVGRSLLHVDEEAMMLLETYEWPGNVRELRNFAYRLAARVTGNIVRTVDLPREVHKNSINEFQTLPTQRVRKQFTQRCTLRDRELEVIRSVLHELNGNVTETARRLGVHRSTIYRKIGRTLSKENWMT